MSFYQTLKHFYQQNTNYQKTLQYLFQRQQKQFIHYQFDSISFLSLIYAHQMSKNFTSCKIPSNPNTTISQFQNHKCYFHNTSIITNFCTNKKCTLPLCQKCIPIHIKQHLKQQATLGNQNIIPFSQAYQIAIKNLQQIINSKNQNNAQVRQKIVSTKNSIEDIIYKQFTRIEQIILNRQNQAKIISQKFNKIKRGSLKTLIFYFSDQETLKQKSQTDILLKNYFAEIPQLIEKLRNSLSNYPDKQQKTLCQNISNLIKQSSIKDKNLGEINQALSVFGSFKSNMNQKQALPESKEQSEENRKRKYESSSDFCALLKDQKSRLERVRNKNTQLAMNYACENKQGNFEKHGSKSVDNFYLNKREEQQNKEQKENRPVQTCYKSYKDVSIKGGVSNKTVLKSNSQQKLQQIKHKYIGNYSLSKQNINADQKYKKKESDISLSKYSSKNTHANIMGSQIQSNELSNRILSRDEIRVNIQNRLNQRSISVMPPGAKQKYDFQRSNYIHVNELFSQKKQNKPKQQSLRKPPIKQIREEFTLNKNYHEYGETRRNSNQLEKVPMSSIKRELRAEPVQINAKQTGIKKFFDDNNRKVGQVNMRDEKLQKANKIFKTKHQITDFIVEKDFSKQQQGRKAKIIHNQNIRNQPTKKDVLYEQTKQMIRLNQPFSTNKEVKSIRNESRESISDKDQRLHSDSKRIQGRRFNYLYDSYPSNQNPILDN